MRKNKDNFVYIRHIRDAIEKIFVYTQEHDYEYFLEHDWDQAAAFRFFEVIGEATNNIDKDFKEKYPEIEWRAMVGFRNFLIQDYADVEIEVVWKTMMIDIPILRKKIEKLLEEGTKIIS